jgi:acyl carrier protein
MLSNEIVSKIRPFVQRHVRTSGLDDDDDIFAAGHVNSMFAMQLVSFLEREFGIAIGDSDLTLSNFCSVSAMCRLVTGLRSEAGA